MLPIDGLLDILLCVNWAVLAVICVELGGSLIDVPLLVMELEVLGGSVMDASPVVMDLVVLGGLVTVVSPLAKPVVELCG